MQPRAEAANRLIKCLGIVLHNRVHDSARHSSGVHGGVCGLVRSVCVGVRSGSFISPAATQGGARSRIVRS